MQEYHYMVNWSWSWSATNVIRVNTNYY